MTEESKIRSKNKDVFLRVRKGHFATMHSHTNYFINVTKQKMLLSEAKASAQELMQYFNNNIIDAILCIDGMEVIATCMAEMLTAEGYVNLNAGRNIYIATPEYINGGQLIFRDNLVHMINGKHVLVLAASVTTGKSALAAIDAITYYGGTVVGVGAIFATVEECDSYPVHSIFDPNSLEEYQSFKPNRCPICERGEKLEALVNSFGYSKL